MSEIRNYLNFEIIKESWNVYNLHDGSILKTRNMLRSAWYVKDGSERKYSIDVKSDTVLMCEPSLQGQKSEAKFVREEAQEKIDVEDCRYDTLSYEPEEYLLDGNVKILIHTNITKISRTKLFDKKGDRIYLSNVNISVTITPPKQ